MDGWLDILKNMTLKTFVSMRIYVDIRLLFKVENISYSIENIKIFNQENVCL